MKLDLKEWIAKITALLNKPITYIPVQTSTSISAGTTKQITFTNVAPSGYKMIGLNSYVMGGTYFEYLTLNRWTVSNGANEFSIYLRALTSSSTITVNITCYVLCVREELYNVVGGVVRKLLKALKPLTLGRGWAV